jgi:hypothetical protein
MSGQGWDEVLQGHVFMEQVEMNKPVSHNVWGNKNP